MNQKKTGLFILFIIILSQILFLFQSCSASHFSFVDTETRLSSVEGFEGLILINNDDPYTKDKKVTLTLFEGLVGVTEMKISHNEDCSNGQWEPYSETKPWTLSQTNQQTSVYVKYRDRIDSESSCYSDDIVHDSLPPRVIFQEAQNQFIASNSYQTRFKAFDSGSGLLKTQCFQEGAGKEDCTTTYDVSSLTEGAHSVSVEAKDRAGNKKTYVYHFSVDTSQPQISFTRKPAERSNKNQNIEFRWVARDSFSGISRVECKMDDEAYTPCSQSQSYSTLSDGDHSFSIKATDNLGHVLEKTHAFFIDTQAPECVLEEKPGPFIRSDQATFRFRSEAGASFFCKKSEDGGSANFQPCSSPQSYSGLSHNSSHTFTLQCRDSSGNVAEASSSWHVDLTAPEVTITKTPSALVSNQEQEGFRVVVEDRESGISQKVCTLDGQACPDSITQGLATTISVEEGTHRLRVQATNEAGGVTTEIFDWLNDRTPPRVIFQEAQNQFIASNSYQTRFEVVDSGSGLLKTQCFQERAGKEDCTTTYDVSSLTEGAHSVSVEAEDRAGNKKTYVYHFSVDTSQPQISFTRKPAERSNKNQNIEFRWVAQDSFSGISRVECKMDDEAYTPCSQSQSYSTLSDGDHSFSIKATDNLGHVLEKTHAFFIDTQAPECVLEEKPRPFIRSDQATFRFRSEAGASFFCKKSEDGGSANFQPCSSPQSYSGLSHNSSHTFTLQCRDSLGNVAEASSSWHVDLTAPEVMITKTPNTLVSNQEQESFRVMVEDRESGISQKVCTLDGQACPNSITQGLATTISVEEGTHRLRVQATNEAGGVTTETFDWLNDRTPPEITFTQKPPKIVTGGVHDITLAWTVRDLAGSTEVPGGVREVMCSFQGGNEVYCLGLRNLPLPNRRDGVYHFTVRATDQVGNQASKTHRWVIDNYEQKTSTVHVTENLKSDILFVIDNSGSMKEEQRELADKIDGFLNIVDELDYHIAFTTTSHHKGGFLKIKHSRNRRGFVYVESDGTPYTGETPYVLKKNLEGRWTNHEGTQVYSEVELLGDTILSAGTDGSGNEKGILASYKAIERRDTYPFNDFFRDEAPLSIILISDEDENSEGRNINYTPQEFKVFFEGVWPGKRLKFHSIIKPDRSRCRQAEHVGHRYKELSELTSGLVLPICAESYTEHLGHIGESIRNVHKTIPLECEPRDEDRDGDVKDDIRLPAALQGLDFSIQGRELQFTSDVPLGTHKIVYSCDKS